MSLSHWVEGSKITLAPTATRPSPALAIKEQSMAAQRSSVFFILFIIKVNTNFISWVQI
jgi:hypothetical protein